MTEKLLQFIWRLQYYNNKELHLDSGENLQIIFPGNHNHHQGPDFLEGKIKIDDTVLAGNIELHVRASDWEKHAHANDKNYQNIILHVVWENDEPKSLQKTPTLTLNKRVSKLLLNKYEQLMHNSSFIPCEKMVEQASDIIWSSWKQRLLVERMERKSKIVEQYLDQSNHHWEEAFWWMLAKNFGAKVNAEAFEAMAKTISINILAKHKSQIHQLEALLLGQCGLLDNEFKEDYPVMLQKEYLFLKAKYNLQHTNISVHLLRMRPGNLPTVRLAQLAMFVSKSSHLFSKIKEMESVDEAKKSLAVSANDYWNYHYVFDEESAFKEKSIGRQMTENIIINTMVPIFFSYGHLHKENKFKERSLKWLEDLPAEKNNITNQWAALKIINKNAFDSQSLIELKTQYCDKKRCLECAIGNRLLKNSF